MRIDKLLSNLKYGSRKDMKTAIKQKKVIVNGNIVTNPGFNVQPVKDIVLFDGHQVFYKKYVTIMMNKPQGFLSANEDKMHPTVFDLLKDPYHRFDLKVAGRLDKDTEGLLLLSNDGDFIHSIIQPNKNVYKKYFVEVDEPFDSTLLLNKMMIKDGFGRPFTPKKPLVEKLSDTSFYLSITEGKYHQVKQMCRFYNREVVYLKRVAIGVYELDPTLKLGEYKEL